MAGTFYVHGNVSGNILVASKISPPQARGHLKERWSEDKDIQALLSSELLSETKQKLLYDWIFLILGILLMFTVIGIALTVVFVPMALWGFARAKHNQQVVADAIEQLKAEK